MYTIMDLNYNFIFLYVILVFILWNVCQLIIDYKKNMAYLMKKIEKISGMPSDFILIPCMPLSGI
jgi:hypothetical protein